MCMKKVTVSIGVVLILLALFSCTDNYQRHYQLGKWYHDKGLINEAILEFKASTRAKADNHQAHQSLAIAYTTKRAGTTMLWRKQRLPLIFIQPTKITNSFRVIKQKQNLEAIEALELE